MTTSADTTRTIELTDDKRTPNIVAVARLASARQVRPELAEREAEARVELAAAIMTMDEIRDEAVDEGFSPLLMLAEGEVETLKNTYAQALADLLRGYPS